MTTDTIVTLACTAGGMVATWSVAYFGYIRPIRKEKREREEAEEAAQGLRDAFLDGVEPIDGVIEGAEPAALRLMAVEAELQRLGAWQLEANGTATRTEQKVDAIIAKFNIVVDA